MTARIHARWTAVAIGALMLVATAAIAQYSTDLEALNAAPGGVVLTGQDGWTLPAASVDWMVYTYAGNTLALPQNPTGGGKFAAGTSQGGTSYARAEHALTIGLIPQWQAGYDFAGAYLGAPPATNNLGSFSVNPTAPQDYIHLASWVDVNAPTSFNFYYLAYDAAGVQFAQPGQSPGPAWSGLALNHWYRAWEVFDFSINQIIEVGIRDLTTGVQSIVSPVGWFLEGGAGGSTTPTTGFRFFAGGTTAGNTFAFDNLAIEPRGPTALEQTTWGRIKSTYRTD
jgi:hypothetical protein